MSCPDTEVIPPEIGLLENLGILNLEGQGLTGEIPPELFNLNLWYLNLSDNELSGELPSTILDNQSIVRIYLHNNELSGIIPEEICNTNIPFDNPTYDWYWNFAQNNFCYPYPSCISDFNCGNDAQGGMGCQNISNCE